MRRFLQGIALLLLAGLLYLLLWPVPIDPLAWEPPPAPALEGPYAVNADLAAAERIPTPGGHGPEDVDVDAQGRIYAGLQEGKILRIAPDGASSEVFAETGGRPLGLHWDGAGNLLVADPFAGLLSISPAGQITTLVTEVAGKKLTFTNDLETTAEGVIYFSDASARFEQHHWKMDIIENGPNGRLLRYDPRAGQAEEVLSGLHFANGVAVDPGQRFVLVNETSRYRVTRLWIAGPQAGQRDVFADNLPGFPDGVSAGESGLFWIALGSPRNGMLDALGPHPALRRAIVRLPDFLQPAPVRHAHVVGLDATGQVRCSLQDPRGERIAVIASVQERGGWLYLGSLTEPALARLPVPERCR